MNPHFKPHHVNATPEDLMGNNGVGRYILLPGSSGRAKQIADSFSDVILRSHDRGHHLYLGTITSNTGKKIEVATVATGMGCPSLEIILHELFHLGAARFLRVGTAGSLQKNLVPLGSLICATAAVRDESTTQDYASPEIPALASIEMVNAIREAAKQLHLEASLRTGIVHCKSSLYAREFGAGPKASAHEKYLDTLMQQGVLASEMETAELFIQSQWYNFQVMQDLDKKSRVLSGAILAIISLPHQEFSESPIVKDAIQNSISLALETVKVLAANDE